MAIRVDFLAVLTAAVLWPGAGHGQKIDPSEVRFITPTSASSLCIGDARTPLCAIETAIGCTWRVSQKGCDLVSSKTVTTEDRRVEYVIVRAGSVNKNKVARAKKEDEKWEFGEYIWITLKSYQALIIIRECTNTNNKCTNDDWKLRIITMSMLKNNWTISAVAIFSPEDWFAD